MNDDTELIDDLLNKTLPLKQVKMQNDVCPEFDSKNGFRQTIQIPIWMAASLAIMLMINVLFLNNQLQMKQDSNKSTIETLSDYMGYNNFQTL